MNINFDKTDRLIQIIDEAVRVLNSAEYNLGRAFKLKNCPNEKPIKLYDELVKIKGRYSEMWNAQAKHYVNN